MLTWHIFSCDGRYHPGFCRNCQRGQTGSCLHHNSPQHNSWICHWDIFHWESDPASDLDIKAPYQTNQIVFRKVSYLWYLSSLCRWGSFQGAPGGWEWSWSTQSEAAETCCSWDRSRSCIQSPKTVSRCPNKDPANCAVSVLLISCLEIYLLFNAVKINETFSALSATRFDSHFANLSETLT